MKAVPKARRLSPARERTAYGVAPRFNASDRARVARPPEYVLLPSFGQRFEHADGFRRSRLALVSAGRDVSEAVERRKAYSKVLYGPFPQFCSSLYVYGAVAPLSGKHFFTEEAKLNTDGFRTFIDGPPSDSRRAPTCWCSTTAAFTRQIG